MKLGADKQPLQFDTTCPAADSKRIWANVISAAESLYSICPTHIRTSCERLGWQRGHTCHSEPKKEKEILELLISRGQEALFTLHSVAIVEEK